MKIRCVNETNQTDFVNSFERRLRAVHHPRHHQRCNDEITEYNDTISRCASQAPILIYLFFVSFHNLQGVTRLSEKSNLKHLICIISLRINLLCLTARLTNSSVVRHLNAIRRQHLLTIGGNRWRMKNISSRSGSWQSRDSTCHAISIISCVRTLSNVNFFYFISYHVTLTNCEQNRFVSNWTDDLWCRIIACGRLGLIVECTKSRRRSEFRMFSMIGQIRVGPVLFHSSTSFRTNP